MNVHDKPEAAAVASESRKFLKTGDEFKKSLQDGRVVYYLGEQIEDVTKHFATAGGIQQIAEIYDDQYNGPGQSKLTYTRDDGQLVTTSYMVPHTREDLAKRRDGIKHVARKTWGTHCRGIDMISCFPVGMIGYLPTFQKHCPELVENIVNYRKYAEENNIYLSETIVDPQGYRGRSGGTTPDTKPPHRAVARIVKENSKGVWISGLKGVGTVAPQCNEILVGSFHPPAPDESFWTYIPANAPGVRMFCREVVHRPGSSTYDHPVAARGEEAEAMVVFDEVFVPRERLMSLRSPELASVNFFNKWAAYSHWYTFVRSVAKAELYAGLAQVIIEVLELEHIPLVRQRVSEIIQFAQILQGMCIASEAEAKLSEGDVLIPEGSTITAGRIFAMENLPWVLHLLRDLCGQGLILRFSEKDLSQKAAFGQQFSWFLDTQHVTANEKNLLMNLVWDVAASEHSTRSMIFEEQNALNAPLLRERMFGEYDRAETSKFVRDYINLPPAPPKASLAPLLNQQTSLGGGGHRAFAGGI